MSTSQNGRAPTTAKRGASGVLRILLPVIALARLMYENLVNIPFLDDYMFTDMLDKARHGFRWSFDLDMGIDPVTGMERPAVLTLHDFFVVQMEHRMAFVRGVILLLHKLWPILARISTP